MMYELLDLWRQNQAPQDQLVYQCGKQRYKELKKKLGVDILAWGIDVIENEELQKDEVKLTERVK